jgi:hypothetical protein
MRWSSAIAASVMLALSSASLHAQVAAPNFAPLEFLVGSCWIATFPDGKQTDEHCFEWVFDKKFIRDKHVVRGGSPYQGETVYGIDPNTKALSYWYWTSRGQVVIGLVEYHADSIVFPSRYQGANGEVELKAVWTRVGTDGYRASTSQRAGSEWKTLFTMNFIKR